MANETPKKPIRRAVVPQVKKEIPTITDPSVGNGSKVGQNIVFFLLFLLVSGIVYTAVFKPKFIMDLISEKGTTNNELPISDTTAIVSEDTSYSEEEDEEFSTIIGEERKSKKNKNGTTVYPAGSQFYLIAGTFIFYPYAEQHRDKMKAEGYNAQIISTGEDHKFHRIYIATSNDIASMRAKRDELIAKGVNVWIYAE